MNKVIKVGEYTRKKVGNMWMTFKVLYSGIVPVEQVMGFFEKGNAFQMWDTIEYQTLYKFESGHVIRIFGPLMQEAYIFNIESEVWEKCGYKSMTWTV